MRKRKKSYGGVAASFGIGLFLAICFPAKYLVVILAIAVTVCGLILCGKR